MSGGPWDLRDHAAFAHDVRDRFGWARLGTPFALTGIMLLAIVTSIALGRSPEARTRGQAVEAAHIVAGKAWGMARSRAKSTH